MENTGNLTHFTLKEKYLSIEPERRIRRYQFFVRSLIPGIIFMFLMMIIGGISAGILFMVDKGGLWIIGINIINLIATYLLYCIYKPIVIKRCHDFGSSGNIAKYIIFASMVINIIQDIIKLALLKGWIKQDLEKQLNILNNLSGNTSNDLGSTMGKTADVMSQIVSIQPLWMQILGTIGTAVAISSFILYIILLFRPGNPEANEFGENPKNVKLGFLG